MSDQDTPAYAVLPAMCHGDGDDEEVLSASFTANNGIRLQIRNADLGPDWAVFDLEPAEARTIGSALICWAKCQDGDRP